MFVANKNIRNNIKAFFDDYEKLAAKKMIPVERNYLWKCFSYLLDEYFTFMVQGFSKFGIPETTYYAPSLGASLYRCHKSEIGQEDEYSWSCCLSESPIIHFHHSELFDVKQDQKTKEYKMD